MAYTVTAYGSNNRSPQYKEYEIDTPDDLDTLPSQAEITAIGSLAHSKSNGVTYKLGNDRQWYALSEGGGSGLPESTAQDAGKVLTVGSTGAAEWDETSIYDCIIDTDPDDYSLHLRGTYADLTAALLAGKVIHILEFDGDDLMNAGLMATADYMSIATQVVIYLSSVIKTNSSVTLIQNDYTIAANGDVTKDIVTATLTES